MENKFTVIKTIIGEEVFYGVADSFGNKEEMISISEEEVQNFANWLNEAGDVDFIHIHDLMGNFFYDIIER